MPTFYSLRRLGLRWLRRVPHRLFKRMHAPAAASGEDPFRVLPDELLWHVISFLPSDDALQTCVLDTRWLNLWRSTTSLDLYFVEGCARSVSCERFKTVVKLIIHLRGNLPLVKCGIDACPDDDTNFTYTNTMLLIKYALACQVKDLVVRTADVEADPPLTLDVPLISQHLKTIYLESVDLECSALDFSHCPVLEDLEMQHCCISARGISSKSLKRLCITNTCFFPNKFHILIFAPGLLSLVLDWLEGLPPFLAYMPLLETAFVRPAKESHDFCCENHAYPIEQGQFLNALASAVNLELTALPEMSAQHIYEWDLECCPIFEKLKSLLLNEWFKAIDLVCILQHSPILEMLTLQLDDTEILTGATGSLETIEQPFVSAHLKVVIECRKVDEGIHKILKILSTCGVLRDHISIKDLHSRSECFSFQKPPHNCLCWP